VFDNPAILISDSPLNGLVIQMPIGGVTHNSPGLTVESLCQLFILRAESPGFLVGPGPETHKKNQVVTDGAHPPTRYVLFHNTPVYYTEKSVFSIKKHFQAPGCYNQDIMKFSKLIGSAALLTLLVSCSTSAFMGLSKASYVESEIQRLNQTVDAVEEIRAEITEIERLAGKVEEFRTELNEVKAVEEELIEMADTIKARLDKMPEAVMRELVAALEAYLSEKNGGSVNTDNPLTTDN
jgi:hypothetical protein